MTHPRFPRPGYDGVRRDTRRPPIPDLPLHTGPADDGDTEVRWASAAFLGYFGVLIVVASLVAYTFSATNRTVRTGDYGPSETQAFQMAR
jgi:hypothetical protein